MASLTILTMKVLELKVLSGITRGKLLFAYSQTFANRELKAELKAFIGRAKML